MSKDNKKKRKQKFIARVSKYGNTGRKHIEVPKPNRDDFEPGDYVEVKKL